MKKMNKITLLIAIAMIAFTVKSYGQETASGTSTTTVVKALTIAAGTQGLAFGDVTHYGAGGTITVPASATLTTTATATGDAQAVGGTVSSGSFDVGGETGKVYTITLPANGVVSLAGSLTGSAAIPVTNFTKNITEGTIGTNNTFYVGGTITLASTQAVDKYSGTYTVTVQYK